MIQIIELNTIDEVLKIIKEQKFSENINRYRSAYLYRGLVDSNYSLATSLSRNCKGKQAEVEGSILRNFSKYASMEYPMVVNSVWHKLIVGQHHGLPTRLLDWTTSPLIGLHFATSGEDFSKMGEHDCVLWRIDADELNTHLPPKYKVELQKNNANCFTTEILDNITNELTEFDSALGSQAMVILEPPSIDQRIINQYSFFTIIPMGLNNIEEFLEKNTNNTVKYIIDRKIRWQIRDILDQMNISERMIYPGLDGLSAWLKRHYYVK